MQSSSPPPAADGSPPGNGSANGTSNGDALHPARPHRAGAGDGDAERSGGAPTGAGHHSLGAPPDGTLPEGELPLDDMLEEHLPALQAYVRGRVDRLVQAKESSSDLVQSVCREVIEHIDRFEHRSAAGFKQWLYRTAERKIIDRFRYYTAEKRNAAREAPDLSQSLLADARGLFYTPSHDAMMREELVRAQAAFEKLPDHYQQVIVLSRLQGFSHAQIAEHLGRTEGAVRNLLYRGLAAISDALDGDASEGDGDGTTDNA